MSEQNTCLTVNVEQSGFNAFEVLKSNSAKVKTLPKCTEMIQYNIDRPGQVALGFKSHKVFVSKTELGTFAFAVIDHRGATTITKNTLFTLEIKVKYPIDIQTEDGMRRKWRKYKLAEPFENIPLVDLINCQFEDGSVASVGLLCIPIEPCWAVATQNPFQEFKEPCKVGVAISNRYESNKEIEHPGHLHTGDNQPSGSQEAPARSSLLLTSGLWQFHHKGDQDNYLLMCVTHGDSNSNTLTSTTPIKVELTLRSIAKYSSHLVPPYKTSITVEPWYVKKGNGFVHGLLAIPLQVSTEIEARFFEVVTKCPESLRLEITTLKRES